MSSLRKQIENLRRRFTLIETVIAMAVLTLGLVAAMSLAASSTNRVIRASDRWRAQHYLSQAAEFYLTMGPDVPITDEFFPLKDYRVSCRVTDPEGLPDTAGSNPGDTWKLKTIVVEVSDSSGRPLKSVKIDKLMRDDTFK
jgi:type II secretory pathway pseudopilin PulG